jgi:hypothetical protein
VIFFISTYKYNVLAYSRAFCTMVSYPLFGALGPGKECTENQDDQQINLTHKR